MKFSAAAILLAGSAIAAPSTNISPVPKGNTLQRFEGHVSVERSDDHANVARKNQPNSFSSPNWAGAIITGEAITEVTGTFTVPTPKSPGMGAAWVGIDGATCDTAILQTGIRWELSEKGKETEYFPWYQWLPGYGQDFTTELPIKAGDSIRATVTSTSTVRGTAKIENLTTGKSISHTFQGKNEVQAPLCNVNAEWIVERFTINDRPVKFANFNTLNFTHASAVQHGARVGLRDAEFPILGFSERRPYTSVTLVGNNGLDIKHLGVPKP